jgi:hypothetical protein
VSGLLQLNCMACMVMGGMSYGRCHKAVVAAFTSTASCFPAVQKPAHAWCLQANCDGPGEGSQSTCVVCSHAWNDCPQCCNAAHLVQACSRPCCAVAAQVAA